MSFPYQYHEFEEVRKHLGDTSIFIKKNIVQVKTIKVHVLNERIRNLTEQIYEELRSLLDREVLVLLKQALHGCQT